MKKQNNKRDKAVLQQQKSNVIRDRKGRPFYIEPNTETYYRLNQSEEKTFYLFDARILFSILPIMISELIGQRFTYYALILSILINVGFEVYYRKLLNGLNESTNPPQEVIDTYHSEAVLKAKRSDNIMKILLGVVISFMIISNPYTFDVLGDKGLMKFVGNLVPIIAMAFSLSPITDFFTIQKKMKALKKQD